jgi:hypothetical protein
VQVTSGGMQRGMPQEALHDGDLDTVFQTVSCKAVPQRLPIILMN